jgi:signal transduction histidine kinase
LAITERAVRFHGGKVAAFNRAGTGLMVEIRLPLISAGPLGTKASEPSIDVVKA